MTTSALLLLSSQTGRVAHNQNNGIPSQEHLAYVPILVHRRATLAALATLGGFRPHLLDVLEEQIEMSVVSGGVEWRVRVGRGGLGERSINTQLIASISRSRSRSRRRL